MSSSRSRVLSLACARRSISSSMLSIRRAGPPDPPGGFASGPLNSLLPLGPNLDKGGKHAPFLVEPPNRPAAQAAPIRDPAPKRGEPAQVRRQTARFPFEQRHRGLQKKTPVKTIGRIARPVRKGNMGAAREPLQRGQQPGQIVAPFRQETRGGALLGLQRGNRLFRIDELRFELEDGGGDRHQLLLQGA